MSITYNSLHVDERYSDKLEANLYYASVLVPGVTCDDSQSGGPAGGVYVHKIAAETVEPGRPGRDFTDEEITRFQRMGRDSIEKNIRNIQFTERARKQAASTLIPMIRQLGFDDSHIKIRFRKDLDDSRLQFLYKEGASN
jgi:hypothetical protein